MWESTLLRDRKVGKETEKEEEGFNKKQYHLFPAFYSPTAPINPVVLRDARLGGVFDARVCYPGGGIGWGVGGFGRVWKG